PASSTGSWRRPPRVEAVDDVVRSVAVPLRRGVEDRDAFEPAPDLGLVVVGDLAVRQVHTRDEHPVEHRYHVVMVATGPPRDGAVRPAEGGEQGGSVAV